MQFKKFIISIILGICFLFTIASCTALRTHYEENDKHIPIGFGKEDETILVVLMSKNYNKWLKQRFSENYFGKYLFVSFAEVESSKYMDKKKYRYVFIETEPEIRLGMERNTFVSLNLLDRLTGITYGTGKQSIGYKPLLQFYLSELEAVRKKKQQIARAYLLTV